MKKDDQEHERRTQGREPADERVTVEFRGEVFRGHLLDRSDGGMGVVVERFVPVGEVVRVTWGYPPTSDRAVVVRLANRQDHPWLGLGLQLQVQAVQLVDDDDPQRPGTRLLARKLLVQARPDLDLRIDDELEAGLDPAARELLARLDERLARNGSSWMRAVDKTLFEDDEDEEFDDNTNSALLLDWLPPSEDEEPSATDLPASTALADDDSSGSSEALVLDWLPEYRAGAPVDNAPPRFGEEPRLSGSVSEPAGDEREFPSPAEQAYGVGVSHYTPPRFGVVFEGDHTHFGAGRLADISSAGFVVGSRFGPGEDELMHVSVHTHLQGGDPADLFGRVSWIQDLETCGYPFGFALRIERFASPADEERYLNLVEWVRQRAEGSVA